MYAAYLERQITRLIDKLVGFAFPKPVELTTDMRHDMNIHTLREVNVRLNGKTVGVCLNYCSWSGAGKYYSVSAYVLESNTPIVLHFGTQDEAEQEYLARANYVWSAMTQAGAELNDELHALAGKLHLLEGSDAWVPEAPVTPPPVTASTVIIGKHA